MSVPVKVGSEFLVNSQSGSKVTALSNGGFVVSWVDASETLGDGSGSSIKAQVWAADGSMVGSELLVNTQTTGNQSIPDVATLSNGGFVVSWVDASETFGDGSGSSVKAQIYDAKGIPVGSELLVNTQTAGRQSLPHIAGLSNGGFVVTWEDGQSTNVNLKAQIYDADGIRVGAELVVSTPAPNVHLGSPVVSSRSDGGFVIAWEADQPAPNLVLPFVENRILAQAFAADGTKIGAEVLVGDRFTSPIAPPPQLFLASLANDGFVVSWGEYQLVQHQSYMRIFDANSIAVIPITQVGDYSAWATVAGLSNGAFVAAWSGGAQVFAPDGSPLTQKFLEDSRPFSIDALADGGFIATYSTNPNGGSGSGVLAQIFSLAPAPAPAIVSVTDDVGPQTGVLANGGATDDTNLTVRIATGTNLIGEVIRLLDGETVIGSPVRLTAADIARGYVDIQTGALLDGTHALGASVSNSVGDVSETIAPFRVTVESSTVAVTGIVLEDSNLHKVAVNGRVGPSLAGLTVSVYDGATLVGTTSADGDGNWTLTGVTLTDGLNTLSATVIKADGTIISSEAFAVTALTSAAAVSIASDANYIVFSGGTLEIGSGIDMTGSVVIGNGGVELDYGNTTETVVAGGGAQDVYYGGVSNNTVVEAGGYQGVYFGTANGTRLSGSQQVLQAIANDTTVLDGGTQFVGAGGEAVRSVVHQGGSQYIDGNATAADTIVDGGNQFVSGRATGTIVSGGGSQFVYSAADHTMIGDGGVQLVFGNVTNTIIANGGEQKIYGLGTATGTTVNTAGTQLVWGTAMSTTINGGAQFVLGTATDTTIASGTQYVQAGGSAVNTTIGAGGVEYVYAGGTANGVTFAGPYGYLGLDQSSALTGTISGWAHDFIDLGDILFSDSGTTLAYSDNADHSGGVLTISDGTHLATLNLLGQYTAADFALSSDGHGGSLITNPAVVQESVLAPALAA